MTCPSCNGVSGGCATCIKEYADATDQSGLWRCGHKNQMANDTRVVTDANGVAHLERIPQRFVVVKDGVFCTECSQVVERTA